MNDYTDPVCDSCALTVHRDVNGWWVGTDETSDCSKADSGHTVNGALR